MNSDQMQSNDEWVRCTACNRPILLLPDPIKRIHGEEPAESWFHSAEPVDHKAVAPSD